MLLSDETETQYQFKQQQDISDRIGRSSKFSEFFRRVAVQRIDAFKAPLRQKGSLPVGRGQAATRRPKGHVSCGARRIELRCRLSSCAGERTGEGGRNLRGGGQIRECAPTLDLVMPCQEPATAVIGCWDEGRH
jgi:hypothetical protein